MLKSLKVKIELSIDDFKTSISEIIDIPNDETLLESDIEEIVDDICIDKLRHKWEIIK